MINVCLFHFPRIENFCGYSLDSLDPVPYFPHGPSLWDHTLGTALVRLSYGRQWMVLRQLYESKSVDRMYREKDPSYMRFVSDFVDKFRDADIIILANYNPIHPEVLRTELRKPIKILGFIDDPIGPYVNGIPSLWAFDGAFYISPSYNHRLLYKDALEEWGCRQSFWWPVIPPRDAVEQWSLCQRSARQPVVPQISQAVAMDGVWPDKLPRSEALRRGDSFFHDRDIDVIYVGQLYNTKVDRLVQLRARLGSRLKIYGRWPLAGFGGITRCLRGKPGLWTRVRALSHQERTGLYYRSKIGFDMHYSPTPMETGNIRMYEVPAHGMMLLCDKAGLDAHERIFEPNKEAVFYDSIEDALEKIEYYLEHDEARERIARAGFARVHRDYDGETGLKKLLDWAMALPRKIESKHGK